MKDKPVDKKLRQKLGYAGKHWPAAFRGELTRKGIYQGLNTFKNLTSTGIPAQIVVGY